MHSLTTRRSASALRFLTSSSSERRPARTSTFRSSMATITKRRYPLAVLSTSWLNTSSPQRRTRHMTRRSHLIPNFSERSSRISQQHSTRRLRPRRANRPVLFIRREISSSIWLTSLWWSISNARQERNLNQGSGNWLAIQQTMQS